MNHNVKFKFPLIKKIAFTAFFSFIYFITLKLILFALNVVGFNFNPGNIGIALLYLAIVALDLVISYQISEEYVSFFSEIIYYFRFKKIFSNTPISSTEELFIATKDKYGDRDKIDKILRNMVGDNKMIRGFRIDSYGKFI